jgi:hypothetical protein
MNPNHYYPLVRRDFERIPKTVYASIVASLLIRLHGEALLEDAPRLCDLILEEWDALYAKGIVPQKPIRQREINSKVT